MSSEIKQYKVWEADEMLPDDTPVVQLSDHLATHAYDEEKERQRFEARVYTAHRERGAAGEYLNGWYQCKWLGWSFCAKARAEAAGCPT